MVRRHVVVRVIITKIAISVGGGGRGDFNPNVNKIPLLGLNEINMVDRCDICILYEFNENQKEEICAIIVLGI